MHVHVDGAGQHVQAGGVESLARRRHRLGSADREDQPSLMAMLADIRASGETTVPPWMTRSAVVDWPCSAPHSIAQPPSTGRSTPVIWRDTSLARNRQALATSRSTVTRFSAYSAAWRSAASSMLMPRRLRHVGADLFAKARAVDHAGRDAIDVDVVLADFEREALGDAAQAPFRRRVGHAAGAAAHAEGAADIDDLAVALLDHGRQHGAHGVEAAVHVERDDLVEFFRRGLHAGLADRARAAGDIDQDVDAAP